jgi:hypothetical protein
MRPEKRPTGNRPLRNPHVTVLSGDRLYLLFGVEGWMSTVDALLTEIFEDGAAVDVGFGGKVGEFQSSLHGVPSG